MIMTNWILDLALADDLAKVHRDHTPEIPLTPEAGQVRNFCHFHTPVCTAILYRRELETVGKSVLSEPWE
jgi:hypothetical protein